MNTDFILLHKMNSNTCMCAIFVMKSHTNIKGEIHKQKWLYYRLINSTNNENCVYDGANNKIHTSRTVQFSLSIRERTTATVSLH